MENNNLTSLDHRNLAIANLKADQLHNERRLPLNSEFLLKLKTDANKNDLNEFVGGWSAAFINILITFPINKIMFRQMAYGVKAKSAVKQFKGENLLYIYRGLVPPLVSKTVSGNFTHVFESDPNDD